MYDMTSNMLIFTGGDYPDSDSESYFTDSSFSSGEDLSEEAADLDAMAGAAAEAQWKSVYFHGYLLVKV